jgi:tetratricopeptide (TPR) repeat protein
MMAIANSNTFLTAAPAEKANPDKRRLGRGHRRISWCVAAILIACVLAPTGVNRLHGQTTVAPGEHLTRYYRELYDEGKKRCAQETNSVEVAWMFAQACFDWAEFATNDNMRAEIAQEGIAGARRAVQLDEHCAQGYHYLGLNLGQLARTKMFGALKLLGEMEASWKKSIALDPNFKFAGAHRSLGLLYRDAPGWPTSLGDRSKARFHLKKALEVAPTYPDNHLTLIETYLGWGEKKNAAPLIAGLEKIFEAARKQLTGDDWVLSWGDWQERWKKIKAKTTVAAARSPRLTP